MFFRPSRKGAKRMNTVRAAVIQDTRQVAIQEFLLPTNLGAEDALLKVEMVGVCGSDPAIYKGKMKHLTALPLIPGHEPVGRIVAIGAAAAKRYGIQVGDRVVTEPTIPCGQCFQCKTGEYRMCKNLRGYGSFVPCTEPPYLWGAYSEYMYLAPNSGVHKVADDLPAEAAILVCAVMGNAIQWVQNLGGLKMGQSIVIQGAGQQGLAAVVAARECGASPIIITGLARDTRRLEFARRLGAEHCINIEDQDLIETVRDITRGKMADVVLEVSGSADAVIAALDLARAQGVIVIAGLTGNKAIPLVADKIVAKEIRVQGAFSHDARAVVPAIKLIESRRYPLEEMVTHRYALEETDLALRVAGAEVPEEHPIKVVIVP
jgi:alcohol dehydrogenase